MKQIWASNGDRFLTKNAFLTVSYDDQPWNPREDYGRISKLYVWDDAYYTYDRIESPDDAPKYVFSLIENVFNEDWITRKYDKWQNALAEGTDDYDSRYEWYFEMMEGGDENLPQVIKCLNRHGTKAWPLYKKYYGSNAYISIDKDISNIYDDVIGIAIFDKEMSDSLGCNPRYAYELVSAEVDDYVAYELGNIFLVGEEDSNGELIDGALHTIYGDFDGTFDIGSQYEEPIETNWSLDEWCDRVDKVMQLAFPYIGHVIRERAEVAVYELAKANLDVPDSPEDEGWATMMAALVRNAA